MERDIYHKQYDFELEQRNFIASSTNTTAVSITVIGSALSSLLLAFPYSNGAVTLSFIALSALSAISTTISLIYIFRSVIGYSYQKIPSSAALTAYFEELKNWYKNSGTPQEHIDTKSKIDFYKYLEIRLFEAADRNGINNIRRGNFIHDSTVAIACALAFMGLCAPLLIYAKFNSAEIAHKVELVNLRDKTNNMTENNNSRNGGSSSTQNSVQAQQPAAPAQTNQAKPAGPPNIVFKGSVDFASASASIPKDISPSTGENGKK